MRTVVTKEIEFDMAHRVPNHHSKCKNLHGHRYKLKCYVEGPVLRDVGDSSEGMVIDFGNLKHLMMILIHDVFDHGAVFFRGDSLYGETAFDWDVEQKIHHVSYIPTAENLAAAFFGMLAPSVENHMPGCQLVQVTLWETPTSQAIVYPADG